jgi:hypothetical protein
MEQPPKKSTARELTETAIEAGAGIVPVAGAPIAAALALAMGWAYNRRWQQWFEDLAEAVNELQVRTDGLSFDELAEDEAFVDAVVQASRAAQATHQEEKLIALRNGVLNSLAPDAADVDTQARFFRLVEQFTAAHLRLLVFMHDPAEAFDVQGLERPQMIGGRGMLLERAMPEFRGRQAWYELLHGDLAAARLISSGGMSTLLSSGGIYQSSTTPLGEEFLRFVSAPRP